MLIGGATLHFYVYAKAKDVVIVDGGIEALWLACLVEEISITMLVLVLHCNSQSALALAHNLVFFAKFKHIYVVCHYIWDAC